MKLSISVAGSEAISKLAVWFIAAIVIIAGLISLSSELKPDIVEIFRAIICVIAAISLVIVFTVLIRKK
jgi:hypothetical protein